MTKKIDSSATGFMAKMIPMGMGRWTGWVRVRGGELQVWSKRDILKAVYAGTNGNAEGDINLLPYLNDMAIIKICKTLKLNYTYPQAGR